MTKKQLLDKLKEKFNTVLQEEEGAKEGDITHWQVPVIDIVNDTMKRQWIHFYVQGDNAYWQDGEPKKEGIAPIPNFTERANEFVISKIRDNSIKFGFIKEVNERAKKALVEAIKKDKTKVQAIISEDISGNFSLELL